MLLGALGAAESQGAVAGGRCPLGLFCGLGVVAPGTKLKTMVPHSEERAADSPKGGKTPPAPTHACIWTPPSPYKLRPWDSGGVLGKLLPARVGTDGAVPVPPTGGPSTKTVRQVQEDNREQGCLRGFLWVTVVLILIQAEVRSRDCPAREVSGDWGHGRMCALHSGWQECRGLEWALCLSHPVESSNEGVPGARGEVSPGRSLLLPLPPTQERGEGEEVTFLSPFISPGTDIKIKLISLWTRPCIFVKFLEGSETCLDATEALSTEEAKQAGAVMGEK